MKEKDKDPFEGMSKAELLDYIQDNEADTYLCSMEAHELPYLD